MQLQVVIEEASDMDAVRQLWAQYWDEHHEDLGAQDLATEARALPAGYEAPDGALLVARTDGEILGTVGLQRFDATTADMRRMYVPHEYRGKGVGEALVDAILETARSMGYQRMVLDVGASQVAARHLYKAAGFQEVAGFDFSPLRGAQYLIRDL